MNEKLRGTLDFIWDISKIILISLVIIIPIRYFVVQPFFVRGASMEPTYQQGDYLLVDEISYRFSEPKRGEVIIFRFPGNPSQFYIKRIIGLPGETVIVNDGGVTVVSDDNPDGLTLEEDYIRNINTDGTLEVELNGNEYFVMGDNRLASYDSRRWGPLAENFIIGKVFVRAWPFEQFGVIEAPAY
ncbi:MAG: signal peptidase I [Candidatus Spechtbacterales bacterium]